MNYMNTISLNYLKLYKLPDNLSKKLKSPVFFLAKKNLSIKFTQINQNNLKRP